TALVADLGVTVKEEADCCRKTGGGETHADGECKKGSDGWWRAGSSPYSTRCLGAAPPPHAARRHAPTVRFPAGTMVI
ncbi:MAG: hypothetical protein ACKO6B_12465, partial [Planctomycetia bacterium]